MNIKKYIDNVFKVSIILVIVVNILKIYLLYFNILSEKSEEYLEYFSTVLHFVFALLWFFEIYNPKPKYKNNTLWKIKLYLFGEPKEKRKDI